MNLLMISGKGATQTARGTKNAFYNTLEELHKHFDRIDVVSAEMSNDEWRMTNQFGNVFFHATPPSGQHHDVMTVQEYFPFRNGRLAERIWHEKKIPYMLEIHHVPGYPRAANLRELVARTATRWYIARDARHASVVRVVNQKQTPEFLIAAGVPASKIKYVPSMYIDLEIFRNLNIEKKYDVLFVGRRAANKGIDLFEKLVKLTKLKALIVDGWAKDSQELATLYNQSRLLIVPSYNEGGPRVMLEALACGTPVLATRVGLAPELLPSEYLVDWSAEDIAQKAKRVLEQGIDFDTRAIAQRFEKKAMLKAYAESLHKLV